jgi:hypothetical protein
MATGRAGLEAAGTSAKVATDGDVIINVKPPAAANVKPPAAAVPARPDRHEPGLPKGNCKLY